MNVNRQPDARVTRSVKQLLAQLPKRYRVSSTILFGSHARGDALSDSDADLAVVLAGPPGDRGDAAVDMAGIAFDVMLETDVLLDPLPLWEEEWHHPERFSNPALIAAIQRDGIAL